MCSISASKLVSESKNFGGVATRAGMTLYYVNFLLHEHTLVRAFFDLCEKELLSDQDQEVVSDWIGGSFLLIRCRLGVFQPSKGLFQHQELF